MDKQKKIEDNDLSIELKKVYTKPALTVLGKVSELTAGGSGGTQETVVTEAGENGPKVCTSNPGPRC